MSPKRSGREATESAIVDAATAEFIERGFHGARIEHIADRAGINKALVYRYFGDRQRLTSAVLERQIELRETILASIPDSLAEALDVWFRETLDGGRDLLRLLQREALDHADSELTLETRREEYYRAQVAILERWQAESTVSDEFEAPHLFLALLGLVAFPLAFPQITRLVTGTSPQDASFIREWSGLLEQMARLLAEPGGRET